VFVVTHKSFEIKWKLFWKHFTRNRLVVVTLWWVNQRADWQSHFSEITSEPAQQLVLEHKRKFLAGGVKQNLLNQVVHLARKSNQ
jgi:hypothetical protein